MRYPAVIGDSGQVSVESAHVFATGLNKYTALSLNNLSSSFCA